MPPKRHPKDAQVANAQWSDRKSCISFEQSNPKKRGSAAADRYDKYKVARTVGEALDLGASSGDLKYDSSKGYVNLVAGGTHTQSRPVPQLQADDQASKCEEVGANLLSTSQGDSGHLHASVDQIAPVLRSTSTDEAETSAVPVSSLQKSSQRELPDAPVSMLNSVPRQTLLSHIQARTHVTAGCIDNLLVHQQIPQIGSKECRAASSGIRPQAWSAFQSFSSWRPSHSVSWESQPNGTSMAKMAGSTSASSTTEVATCEAGSTSTDGTTDAATGSVEPIVHKLDLPEDMLEELEEALEDTSLDPASEEDQSVDAHAEQEDLGESGITELDTGPDTIRLTLRLGIIMVKQELPDEDTDEGTEDRLAGTESRSRDPHVREVNVLAMLQNCPRGEEVEAEMNRERQDQEAQLEALAQAQLASYDAHETEKRDREARDRAEVLGGDLGPLMTRDPDLMETLLSCEGSFDLLGKRENLELLWRYAQMQDLAKKWYKDAAQDYFSRQKTLLSECVGHAAFQHLKEVIEKVEAELYAMPEKEQQGLWGAYVPEIFAPRATAAHSEGIVELDSLENTED